MTWEPPAGSVECPGEPGCWDAPDGGVYVSPQTWAEWTHVDPADARRVARERKRWLQHNGWHRPSLEDYKLGLAVHQDANAWLWARLDEQHELMVRMFRRMNGVEDA